MKTTPPTISRFQEIARTAIKIKTGMLWMRKPARVSQKPAPVPKTSNENSARKAMKIMASTLGVQYVNFPTSFSIFVLYQKIIAGGAAASILYLKTTKHHFISFAFSSKLRYFLMARSIEATPKCLIRSTPPSPTRLFLSHNHLVSTK
jgi:hypothetical protein